MTPIRWTKVVGAGLLAGLVAALWMTLVMMLLRYTLGLPTPSELVGERIVPQLTIGQFIGFIDRFGGYNQLKQVGVSSVLAGQLVFGTLGGLVYGVIVERGRRRGVGQPWRWGVSRGGWRTVGVMIVIAMAVMGGLLWPVLGANGRGLPPGQARLATLVGFFVDFTSFGLMLMLVYRYLTTPRVTTRATDGAAGIGRRAILVGGVGLGVALATGGVMRRLFQLATFAYDGLRYRGPNVQAITPQAEFYSVTKNVIDPSVSKAAWRLEISGVVAQPHTYTFQEIADMPVTKQETTLMCISNAVGDGLMSNAVWEGIPLAMLLERAQPQPGIVEVLLHGADGYTDTIPLAKAMDPTTMVVYRINGEPLNERHGYPVRLIVPGMYGEKNVKWVTRIEPVAYDAKGFYEQQGWGPNFIVPIHARFDGPNIDNPLPVGQTAVIKGVAHGGDQGISKVEVSVDDGRSWKDAQIDYPGTKLTWVLWSFPWQPTEAGEYKWVVRATDGNGMLQTTDERGITPQGATGYHKVSVRVA